LTGSGRNEIHPARSSDGSSRLRASAFVCRIGRPGAENPFDAADRDAVPVLQALREQVQPASVARHVRCAGRIQQEQDGAAVAFDDVADVGELEVL